MGFVLYRSSAGSGKTYTLVKEYLKLVLENPEKFKHILAITGLIYLSLLGLFVVALNAPLPQGNMSPFYDYSAFILSLNTQLQQMW